MTERPEPKAFCVDPNGNGIGVAAGQVDHYGRPHVLIQVGSAQDRQSLTLRPDPEDAASFAYALLGAVDQTLEAWTRWKLDQMPYKDPQEENR